VDRSFLYSEPLAACEDLIRAVWSGTSPLRTKVKKRHANARHNLGNKTTSGIGSTAGHRPAEVKKSDKRRDYSSSDSFAVQESVLSFFRKAGTGAAFLSRFIGPSSQIMVSGWTMSLAAHR